MRMNILVFFVIINFNPNSKKQDGMSTHFWHDLWLRNTLLRVSFGTLFQMSQQQGELIVGWDDCDWR